MNKPSTAIKNFILIAGILGTTSCSQGEVHKLITIADARTSAARIVDLGEPGDSAGDIVVFDQPLLNEQGENIGNNSGTCIRTRVAHSAQCQWTLTMENGSIQVTGREFDKATSKIAIVGGTGIYAGISGQMDSTNNDNGTFTQTLHYWSK